MTSPIPAVYLNNNDKFFVGGVLGPNGMVYLIPQNASRIGIYNSILNEWNIEIDINDDLSSEKYAGGLLLRNGNILCIPYAAPFYLEYNVSTNEEKYYSVPSSNLDIDHNNAMKYYGGIVTEDGSICSIPYTSNHLDLIKMNDDNLMDKNTLYSPFFNKL